MINSNAELIATFTWMGRLPADEEIGVDPTTRYSADFGEQWAYQAGQPVATAVLQAIRNLGAVVNTKSLQFDEHAWNFTFVLDRRSYLVFVQWIGREGRNNSFAMQAFFHEGCIASLFRSHKRDHELGAACELIRKALKSHPLVTDLEWVSEIPS